MPSKIGGVNGHDDQVRRAFRYDVVAFWAYVVLCSLVSLNSLQRCSISSKRVSFETVEIALVILKGICLFPVLMSRAVMFRSLTFRHLNTRTGAAIIVPNHSGSSNRYMKFQYSTKMLVQSAMCSGEVVQASRSLYALGR